MAAGRFAWVLNLDADLELAARRGYTPKRSVRLAMASFVPALAASLLGPDDVIVDDAETAHLNDGRRDFVGRAFCPTPRAIARLRRAGVEPEPHPSVEVLRRVNSRAFASALGVTLPGAEFVTELDRARRKLSSPPPFGEAWRVKRAFGMTGRGQILVDPSAVSDAVVAFVRAAMRDGGVQIEPNAAIETEYAMHGMLGADGSLACGGLVIQRCDARGAWLSTERVALPRALEADVAARLTEEIARVGVALFQAGYFGPFGVDAYLHWRPHVGLELQPRSEINARYSMGFGIGFLRG